MSGENKSFEIKILTDKIQVDCKMRHLIDFHRLIVACGFFELTFDLET